MRSRPVLGAQGTVLAEPDGGCTLLCSAAFDKKDVYLIRMDRQLRQVGKFITPLNGLFGRDYDIYRGPRGYLIVGASTDGDAQGSKRRNIVAELNGEGEVLWQKILPSEWNALLAPFHSGFYIVQDSPGFNEGTDIEKFRY